MLPFCGYNMGDYWNHWLDMGNKGLKLPTIFRVNWFRKTADGKWLWPGFGQNMRVLQWVVNRVNHKVEGRETVFGTVPNYDDINWNGLAYDKASFDQLMAVDAANSLREFEDQSKLFKSIGETLPADLEKQRQEMLSALQS